MKFSCDVFKRIAIACIFLAIGSSAFSMDWFKKLLGLKAVQKTNTVQTDKVPTRDSIITIEEKDSIGPYHI